MYTKKTLQELTLKDNFMFGAVMSIEENDMELLGSGLDYSELPNSYVIFICLFDPFDRGKYCYTFQTLCKEELFALADGCQTIFLSTEGKNEHEVSESLVKFLKFVKADLEESGKDYADSYVHQLQNSIRGIKESREMGERYMIFEEMMQEEREKGQLEGRLIAKREAVLELLEELEPVPQSLQEKIEELDSVETLSILLKKAARVDSMEQFIKGLEALLEVKE